MGDLRALAKFAITRISGHFCSRSLRRNVARWLAFNRKVMSRSCNLRRGGFLYVWPKFSVIFSLYPFAKFQKMEDVSAIANFAITQVCGHFCSCSFSQNLVPWLRFKCKLMRRSCDMQQGVFKSRAVTKSRGPGIFPGYYKSRLLWYKTEIFEKVFVLFGFSCFRSFWFRENVIQKTKGRSGQTKKTGFLLLFSLRFR